MAIEEALIGASGRVADIVVAATNINASIPGTPPTTVEFTDQVGEQDIVIGFVRRSLSKG